MSALLLNFVVSLVEVRAIRESGGLAKSFSFDLCRNMSVNSEGYVVWNNQDIPSDSRKYHWVGEEFICV